MRGRYCRPQQQFKGSPLRPSSRIAEASKEFFFFPTSSFGSGFQMIQLFLVITNKRGVCLIVRTSRGNRITTPFIPKHKLTPLMLQQTTSDWKVVDNQDGRICLQNCLFSKLATPPEMRGAGSELDSVVNSKHPNFFFFLRKYQSRFVCGISSAVPTLLLRFVKTRNVADRSERHRLQQAVTCGGVQL